MKNNLFLYSCLFFIAFANMTALAQKNTLNKKINASSQKELVTLSPAKKVSPMRMPKSVRIEKQSQQKTKPNSVGPNNRIVLFEGDKTIERSRLNIKTKINAIDQGRILFDRKLALDYWITDAHKLRLQKGMQVQLQYLDKFVKGVSFKSLRIFDQDEVLNMSLISSGSNQRVTSRLGKNIIIRQTKKEKDFTDNKSEKIKEVLVTINGKEQPLGGEVREVEIDGMTYQLSIQKSWHYYPKGNDSVEAPAFILEYTLTRMK